MKMLHQMQLSESISCRSDSFINFLCSLHTNMRVAVCGHVMAAPLCVALCGFDSDDAERRADGQGRAVGIKPFG